MRRSVSDYETYDAIYLCTMTFLFSLNATLTLLGDDQVYWLTAFLAEINVLLLLCITAIYISWKQDLEDTISELEKS
jgi:hypothetical protein